MPPVEIDQSGKASDGVPPLVRVLARRAPRLIVFAALAALCTFAILSAMTPRYFAQATVLVERAGDAPVRDGEAVARAVQLLHSLDLARSVAEALDLSAYAEFDQALAPPSLVADFLTVIGLRRDPLRLSVEERVLQRFAGKLAVRPVASSRVMAIGFSSENPVLAADIANRIAEEYLSLQAAAVETQQNARILSRAPVPVEPAFPRTGMLVALAAGLALLIGGAWLVMRERLRGPAPMSFDAPLPVVPGAIPIGRHRRWAEERGDRRMMPLEPTLAPVSGSRVEDWLAEIAATLIEDGVKRIMVTTAEGSDESGRPLAAVALVRALARAEQRPVLIDLRDDGANGASMGEGRELVGFADLFAGRASFADVIFRDTRSRAHFIPAGHGAISTRNLSDTRAAMLFGALDQTYDQLIFDLADDALAAVGEACQAALVVSEFPAADPRTVRAFDRISAASDAPILLLIVDPAAHPQEMPESIEAVRTAA